MVDLFGYMALTLGLFAVTKKRMHTFRLWQIASAICYLIYGILLWAYPIMIGGTLFLLNHFYKLYKTNLL